MGDLEGTFSVWEAFRDGLGGRSGVPWEGALGGRLGGLPGMPWEAVPGPSGRPFSRSGPVPGIAQTEPSGPQVPLFLKKSSRDPA